MRRALLGIVAAALGLGCVEDRPCREGTVLVTFRFAQSAAAVDGVALVYRLDEGPLVNLAPLGRPAGADQGALGLEVKSYASRRQLGVRFAGTRAGQVVGAWNERSVALEAVCTAIEVTVDVANDGGSDALEKVKDAPLEVLRDEDAWVSTADTRSLDASAEPTLTRDAATDVVFPPDTSGEPDVPLTPPDAQPDIATDIATPPVKEDAGVQPFFDAPPEAGLDGSADLAWPDAPSFDGASDSTTGGCFIDGAAYALAAVNPGNTCQVCQPTLSTSVWTSVANGSSCASGQCSAGICQAGCWIDGVFRSAGIANPGNACQSCQPSASRTGWSNLGDGTDCGAPKVCIGGACQPRCWIGSAYYADGMNKPDNTCQSCQTGTSTSAWTDKSDGTLCGSGQGCSGGTCTSGCWIDSIFYVAGTLKPGNACQSCQPVVSTAAWSHFTDGTTCGDGKICSGGECGDCRPGATKCKDTSVQQICQASRTWVDNTTCTYGCNVGLCALNPDGTPCLSAAECASNSCSQFYSDVDGDGYGATIAMLCGATPPSGYVTNASDCCDSDKSAWPNQTNRFSTPRIGCGGYDYNCNGFEEKGLTAVESNCYGGGVFSTGWVGSVPACGATHSFVVACFLVPGLPTTQREVRSFVQPCN